MKIVSTILIVLMVFAGIFTRMAYGQYQYISPMPGSTWHHPETNIILKNGSMIDEQSLKSSLITVSGSSSGVHPCRIVLSDDNKTIVVYPLQKFLEGEQVSVSIEDGFRKKDGDVITGTTFNFSIRAAYTTGDKQSIADALKYSRDIELTESGTLTDPIPDNTRDECFIPPITITPTGNELKEDLFFYNQRVAPNGCWGRSILTNEGDSIFGMFDTERGISWNINKNGYLTYYSYVDSSFDMMDSSYNVVKQFFMGNGFRADEHEFLVFPNGHSFMFCYDVHPNLDLSDVGGLDTVDVVGCVIQELDADQNVIFQWRSWDYMLFTDAIYWQEALLGGVVYWDWIHANSMEIDYDGNLLLSSRHLCEITKIDLSTGDIIWRFGGDNNQFTFVNDPGTGLHFSGQHDFRRIANGNYTLFNNGNNVSPNISGAKEYELDQVNKIATLKWSYKHPQIDGFNLFSPAMGNVQRLSNGNTFINWGFISSNFPQMPRFTEVDSAGNIVWEFNFVGEYYICYRAYKYDWNRCAPPVDSTFQLINIDATSAELTWSQPNFNSSYIFQYKLSSAVDWISVPVVSSPFLLDNLLPDSTYQWRVQSVCSSIGDTSAYSGIDEFSTLSVSTEFTSGYPVSLSLYPNPAAETVNVSFSLKENTQLTISLTNLLGEVLKQESWAGTTGKNQKVIAVDQLPAGVYMVELKGHNLEARRQLVIR